MSALVNDAVALITALEGASLSAEQADAVGLLALVAGQDVEPGDSEGTWRIAQRTAPDRVISVVDPEARHIHKTVHDYRDGYKAHVAVEPETGLVTDCVLTAGNVSDGSAAVGLLADEKPGLEIYADTAYGSGQVRADLRQAGHDAVIKPMPIRPAVPNGFDRDDFSIDHHGGTVTCTAGHTATISPRGSVRFDRYCKTCPLRMRYTTASDGRRLDVTRHDDELVYARRAWTDPIVLAHYRQHRPMVERTLAWLVAGGNRRLRYRGVARNQLWLATRLAAVNLGHLVRLGLGHDGTTWMLVAR